MDSTKKPKKESVKIPKEAKDIGDGLEKVGKSSLKAGEHTAKGIYKVGEESIKTGVNVSQDVYQVGKASVETGVALGKGVASVVTLPYKKRRSIWDFFWKSKGGVITGAADNDPAGIVTYIQTGATAGFHLLWLVPLAWPLLVVVEAMSAKIGIITKRGVNANIIKYYGKFWAYLAMIIVFLCNTVTIGADIAAMSDISSILTRINSLFFVIFFGLVFVYLMVKNGYAKISRYLFIITPVFFLYVISAILFKVPWGEAIRETFIPRLSSFNPNFYMIALAFLGTTLSPYLIYWQTTQEIEEKKDKGQLEKEKLSVVMGMFFTQFITFFIVVTGAVALAGTTGLINSAKEAALALAPFGKLSFILFSLGIFGSGLIAVPVLAASTGYVMSETLNWESSLNKSFGRAKEFYIAIIVPIIIGMFISFFGINPIKMLIYSQVLNGALMPILVIFLILICNNKKIMGKYTNHWWTNIFSIITVVVLVAFMVLMVVNWGK